MKRYNGKDPLLDLCYCFENGVVQVADINETGFTVICSVNLNTSLTGLSIAKRTMLMQCLALIMKLWLQHTQEV
jgi:hypothetical protein